MKELFLFVIWLYLYRILTSTSGLKLAVIVYYFVFVIMAVNASAQKRLAEDLRGSEGSMTEKKRRESLRSYDYAAAQFLNAFGRSFVADADLQTVLQMTSKGNDGVLYFSELWNKDPKRQQVAVSRLVEALTMVNAELGKAHIKAIVKEDVLKKVQAELSALMKATTILMLDEAVDSPSLTGDSAGKLNYQQRAGAKSKPAVVHDAAAVSSASRKLYEFLTQEKSTLRSFLQIMSSGGVFYTSSVHEKVCRAFCKTSTEDASKPTIDMESFIRMNKARLCPETPSRSSALNAPATDYEI